MGAEERRGHGQCLYGKDMGRFGNQKRQTKIHKDRIKRAGDNGGRDGHAAAIKPKTLWTQESCGVRL